MKRIKLTVAYDGTNYHGWQMQPNGITVEEVLNKAITELTGEPAAVIGASRTDSGVHALGNVAVFDTDTKIPPEKLCYAINQRLPEDIVVQHSCEVPLHFHPRRCASRKAYVYKILNRTFPLPLNRHDCYFTYRSLDVGLMRHAAAYLVGTHDYKSFCSVHSQAETTVRTIYELAVDKEQDFITVRVTGSGFLYNMVRILVGTLLQVGMGERSPEEMQDILKAKDRSAAGPTAPAHGLTMVGISFQDFGEYLK